jgi:hypothetical protein
MGFEQNLANNLFSSNSEKTFVDKILAKDDVLRVRELLRKKKLDREDYSELLNLMSGNEAKLLNYSEWERYLILKFFIWIRDFLKVAELLYDYQDDLKKKENVCSKCKKLFNKFENNKAECKCENPEPLLTISTRTRKILDNIEKLCEHNLKFLIDLYFNISRTGLSVGATGLLEIIKNKYEISYPNQQLTNPVEEKKPQLFKQGG